MDENHIIMQHLKKVENFDFWLSKHIHFGENNPTNMHDIIKIPKLLSKPPLLSINYLIFYFIF